MTTKSKNLTDRVDTTCVTDFIWNDNDGKVSLKDAVVDDFAFTPGMKNLYIIEGLKLSGIMANPSERSTYRVCKKLQRVFKRFRLQCYLGSIWTLMIHYDENTKKCEIRYGQDSNGNEVNIFLLVPQYVVITIGEVSH